VNKVEKIVVPCGHPSSLVQPIRPALCTLIKPRKIKDIPKADHVGPLIKIIIEEEKALHANHPINKCIKLLN
jgi:hypothetical protein